MSEKGVSESIQRSALRKAIESGREGHAWIFAGPSTEATELCAGQFAFDLIGSPSGEAHPDIIHVRPMGRMALLTVDSIRQMISEGSLPPTSAQKKVFILHAADRMQPVTANALLKFLEEPSQSCVVILLVNDLNRVLGTIRSRCRLFRVDKVLDEEIGNSAVEELVIAMRSALMRLIFEGARVAELTSDLSERLAAIKEEEPTAAVCTDSGMEITPSSLDFQKKQREGAMAIQQQEVEKAVYAAVIEWGWELSCYISEGICRNTESIQEFERHAQTLKRMRPFPFRSFEQIVVRACEGIPRLVPFKVSIESLFIQIRKFLRAYQR